jgi:hypothetical protein
MKQSGMINAAMMQRGGLGAMQRVGSDPEAKAAMKQLEGNMAKAKVPAKKVPPKKKGC